LIVDALLLKEGFCGAYITWRG